MKCHAGMRAAMRLLVELSGEQVDLARAEALAALEASGRPFRVLLVEARLLVVETDVGPSWLAGRLALAHVVDEVLAWGGVEEIVQAAKALDFGTRTFRVRVNSFKGCHEKVALEARIGGVVRGAVNLTAPDEEVRLIEAERHYLTRRLAVIDRHAFEARKVGGRAFVQPISLHPRLARALVNLARVPDGGAVLDPFCGTGGILIEAALIGAHAIGSDVRPDMVEGCRASLTELGLRAELFAADVGDVAATVPRVDAVAMDPPYGRATSTKGEPLAALYRRAVDVAARVLRPGGYLAMILPDPNLALVPPPFEAVEAYPLRVHKSLTRHFVVMRLAG